MKYILGLFMAFIATGSHAIPMLSLNPSSTTLGFNEAFTVEVLLTGVESIDPLIAFGFDVGTDTGLVYQGATVASPLLDDSAFFASTDVAGSTFPGVFGDDILLSTLSLTSGFTAGLLDVAVFSDDLGFGSSEGIFTPFNTFGIDESFTVEVVGGISVPSPSSLLLVGLGLFGLWVRLGLA